jgi:predicted nucleic acid-binding protein
MVVSDTSPLNYLVLIGETEILPRLYGEIWIPEQVLFELTHDGAPAEVRDFANRLPGWLKCAAPRELDSSLPDRLDMGEVAAIALAREYSAKALLIDDRAGRAEAQNRGLDVIGTLGILDQAAIRGLIDLRQSLKRLSQTSFRMPHRLMKLMLDRG